MLSRGKLLVNLALAKKENSKIIVCDTETDFPGCSGLENQHSELAGQQENNNLQDKDVFNIKTYTTLTPINFDEEPSVSGLNDLGLTGEQLDSNWEEQVEMETSYISSGDDYQPSTDEQSSSSDNVPLSSIKNQLQLALASGETEPNMDNAKTKVVENGVETILNNNAEIKKTKKKIFPVREKKSKKREKNVTDWKKTKSAIARAAGRSYRNYKNIEISAKSPDSGNLCGEICKLKCNEKFNYNEKKQIFEEFYKLNIDAKNALLFKSILMLPVARERKSAKKHKSYSYKYTATLNTKQVFVCKTAFCMLYQIGRRKVAVIQEKLKKGNSAPSLDMRGRHATRPHKMDEQVVQTIIDHINKFPAETSHYSRNNNPHKKYLSPVLNMSIMFRLYIEECTAENRLVKFFVKKASYAKIFSTHFNLSFSKPKSDTCSTCDSGMGNEEHKENAANSFEFQRKDRELARIDTNFCYITIDLQQTMPLPKLTTSKAFYLRQLWFYNFGIHLVTVNGDKSFMQTWTEDVAGRGSSEIASCLWNFIQICDEVKDKKHLVIWSDSCSGQNKNINMIALYQLMIKQNIIDRIDHKFPEVGHSYLDSDRDFGRIEKLLRKHETIYTPQQYRDILRSASKKNAVVNDMENHFRDVETLLTRLGLIHRKKNLLQEIVPFRNIKWIRVDEFGSYLYKETYDEYTPFKKVSLLKKKEGNIPNIQLQRVERQPGKISKEKLENLQAQLKFVVEEHRWFYEKILKENNPDDQDKSKKRKTK